jgi:hypothetical protein
MGRALSTLSKKRYAELRSRLGLDVGLQEEQVEDAMRVVREIMQFDPEEKQYTQEKGQRMHAMRRAKAEALGVSMYALRQHRLAVVAVAPESAALQT